MHVASKKLCAELEQLSGWSDTSLCWANRPNHRPAWIVVDWSDAQYAELKKLTPAYDLGYLLRKLEKLDKVWLSYLKIDGVDGFWTSRVHKCEANNTDPTDAVCDVAIKLFKFGILTPELSSKEKESNGASKN